MFCTLSYHFKETSKSFNYLGQNICVIVPGANSLVTPEYVKDCGEALIRKAKTVIVQLEIPIESSLEALKLAKEHNAISIFNVAPAAQNLPREMCSLPDIICFNESEVRPLNCNFIPFEELILLIIFHTTIYFI